MNARIRLCSSSDVVEGRSLGFDPTRTGRDTMFVVRRNGLFAYRNLCPHWADTSMAWRKNAFLNGDATRIVCAAHGAQFDIESGVCLLGPCLGDALTPFTLFETNDGFLEVDPDELETQV